MPLRCGSTAGNRRLVFRGVADGFGHDVLIADLRRNSMLPTSAHLAPTVLPQVLEVPAECAGERRLVWIEEMDHPSTCLARDEPSSWIQMAAPPARCGDRYRVRASAGRARRARADRDVVGFATTPNCPRAGAAGFNLAAPDGPRNQCFVWLDYTAQ